MSEGKKSLRAIFNQALEIADAQNRAEYLAQVCGADAELRQKIEELIQASKEAGEFLSKPGDSAGSAVEGASGSTLDLAAISEKAGDKIGRYKLLQKIGEGGCGVVYMAEQDEPVRRRVALKVIKLGMDTKSVIARFEAERQALALMDHPNIAKVLDAGATETGLPYFVMELVKDVRITDYCDQNNLTTVERLALFTSVCHAIQHAHQKGIIHRDIKPSNILVTTHDGVPVPKVIDFGIAKATTDQRLTDKTLFTAFEQFIGTPAYMSPEQAEMSGLDIDTRSDIYALGVLLYELLTGKPPFDGKELLASGLDAMRRTIREQEPARPSTRLSTMTAEDLTTIAKHRQTEATKLTNSIRGDLDWIVMKALEKDRTRRYETANGLVSDIQRHLKNEPVVARPPSNLYRLQKLVRRNKLVFAGTGAVVAALLIGLAVSTFLLFKERAAHQRAVAAERKASTEASKSEQVARFLEKMLRGVGPSKARGRDTAMLRETLDKTAESLGTELANQPGVEIELRHILAETYHDLELYPQMEEMARQSLQLARLHFHQESKTVWRSLSFLGIALLRLEKLDEAEKVTRESLALTRKLWGNDDARVATALNNLALIFEHQGRLAEAETTYRQALAMRIKFRGTEDKDVAGTLGNLAHVLARQGRPEEGEAMQRQALATFQKLFGKDDPQVAVEHEGLAIVLEGEGKLAEAEDNYREALNITKKLYGNEHLNAANSLDKLAEVLWRERKIVEAEIFYREALAIREKRLGPGREVAESLYAVAFVLAPQGKLAEAETTFLKSLTMLRNISAKDREIPTLGMVLHHLADVLRQQKKLTEARRFATEAAGLYQRHPEWASHEQRHAMEVLTAVFTELGDLAGLEAFHRDALETQRKLFANEHLSGANLRKPSGLESALVELATFLRSEKRYADAEPFCREALASARSSAAVDAPRFALRVDDLARVLAAQGKLDEAEREGRAAVAVYAELKASAPTNSFYWQEEAHTTRALARMLEGLGRRDAAVIEYRQAITLYQKASAAFPAQRQVRAALGRLLEQKGAFAGVEGAYRLAAEQYRQNAEGGGSEDLNGLAWILATCPDASVRDGQRAVDLASRAVAATQRKDDSYLDTLAAAYAEAGQFAEAVKTQKEAMALLSNNEESTAKGYPSRLKLYESGSPCRQSDE